MRHEWALFRRNAGFTQEAISSELGVSRFFIMNLEKGLYVRPPELTLKALSFRYEVPEEELMAAYNRYVQGQREEFAQGHSSFGLILGRGDYSEKKHPLVSYRVAYDLSRMGLCKGLCLHPKTVEAYEKNRQRGIPEQIIAACNAIKWDYGPLENAVTTWRVKGYADRKGA